jgi:O-antigen ligase
MAKEKWVRLSFYGMVFFSVVAVVLTFSRGGAVALGMTLIVMALRSRHKVLVIALLIASIIPVVILAGSAYTNRLATVADPMSEGSSASRIYLIKIGLHMWRDYPIFGVGFGRTNQQALMPRYYADVVSSKKYAVKVLHNSYIQILVDCGLLGIMIFVLIVYGGIYSMGWWARHTLPEWKPIGLGLQTSLFTFAVGCISVSALPSFAAFPALVTIAASWQVIARQALPRPESEGAPAVIWPQAAPALSH